MNKFKFDYSGLQNLFISNPTIDYLTGETKVNKDIWFNLDLYTGDGRFSDLSEKALKAFIFHKVPAELIFKPDLSVSRMF